jgi:hypothetical protein
MANFKFSTLGMRRAGLLLACLAFCSGAAPLRDQPPSRDQALHAYLQARFRADHAGDPGARYVAAWGDLNGDGRPEVLVYLISGAYCGSGGCRLLVLAQAGRSWRAVADMSITNPPIRLLGSTSHGWRDLAVTVAGGGARAHEALLAFNGRAYPDNPSVPPARALRRSVPGRLLISEGERGRPLFQGPDS